MINENGVKQILATVAAGYASSAAGRWARGRGLDRWVAALLSALAGAAASAAVLRA